jgi:hypothetical protein
MGTRPNVDNWRGLTVVQFTQAKSVDNQGGDVATLMLGQLM